MTDQVVQSADYISLRNINVGYRLPTASISKIGLTGLRVYVAAQNLFYVTADEYTGFNPEYVDDDNPRQYGAQRAGTPLYRTVSVGLNIEF